MREAIALGGGHEVSIEGDAFFVAFLNPAGAVEAAVAAQRKLFAWQGPDGVSLRIRMGLHTGQGTVSSWQLPEHGRQPDRLRIAAAAHGARSRSPTPPGGWWSSPCPGVSLRDLGFHGLKDLPHPKLQQLVIDGPTLRLPPIRRIAGQQAKQPAAFGLTSFDGHGAAD